MSNKKHEIIRSKLHGYNKYIDISKVIDNYNRYRNLNNDKWISTLPIFNDFKFELQPHLIQLLKHGTETIEQTTLLISDIVNIVTDYL